MAIHWTGFYVYWKEILPKIRAFAEIVPKVHLLLLQKIRNGMEIKQLEPKDKVITFFGEFKSSNVESAIKDVVKINISDQEYQRQCSKWAIDNGHD